MTIRLSLLVLASALVAALFCACTLEERSGEVWACDTVREIYGCQDTGIRVH